MEIHFTFFEITSAVVKLLVLAFSGYVLRHRGIIDGKFTDNLSTILVKLIFPALIIHKTVSNFSFNDFPFWWILPIVAVVFSVSGMGLGRIVFHFLSPSRKHRGSSSDGYQSKREFIAGCGFQNSGYLPMNIILFAFPGLTGDVLLVYMFLFLTGFNLLIWSFLPIFFERKDAKTLSLSALFNPPVLATVASLVWVWIFGRGSIPAVLADPMGQLGHAAFPVSMIVLGSYLSGYKAHLPEKKVLMSAGIITKLIIFPAMVLVSLIFIPMAAGYRFFLFVEAIMPSAVTLVIVGSYSGADNRYLSSVIFYSYVASIFTIPLWLGVLKLVMPGF